MSWHDYLRPSIPGLEAYRTFDYRPGLLRLDCNESPFTLDDVDQAVANEELLRQVSTLNRYPDVSGRQLREALARHWCVAPETVLIGNGSDEIISILCTAFAEGKRGRGKVLFPVPTFGEYRAIALSHGSDPVGVPLDESWQLDEVRLLAAIQREQPALGFFASPNNPTGNRFDSAVIERLAGAFPGMLVCDEAYALFDDTTLLPRVGQIENFCVMRSFSKIGLAGLRIGALIGSPALIAELDKVRLPFNVSSISLALACALLAAPERFEARIRRIAAARRELADGLARIPGLISWPSQANFVLVRTPFDATAVWNGLIGRGVVVRNLSRPGPLRDCLRITSGTTEENARCLEALQEVLAMGSRTRSGRRRGNRERVQLTS